MFYWTVSNLISYLLQTVSNLVSHLLQTVSNLVSYLLQTVSNLVSYLLQTVPSKYHGLALLGEESLTRALPAVTPTRQLVSLEQRSTSPATSVLPKPPQHLLASARNAVVGAHYSYCQNTRMTQSHV